MDSPRTMPGYQRVRRPIKRACVDCHARKVRCDGVLNGFPCSNCKTARVDCVVAERRKRKSAPGTSTGATKSHTREKRGKTPDEDLSGTPAPIWYPEQAPTAGSDASDHEGSSGEGPGNRATAEYAGEYELAKENLVKFFNQDLRTNPIRNRSTYVGTELSNLHYLTRQISANDQTYHYPCSNIYVPRVFRNSQVPSTPNLIPKDAFVLPPKHVSDVLVTDYFNHVHPGLPVIDRERFLAQYQDVNSAPSILLLQAVCLAGSHVTKVYKKNQDLKVAFFRRAKALLDGRYEEDRMHTVQAALLLTWFSDGGDDVCANAWWWIGIAAKTAMGLGMHREVGPSKMPDSDKRLWKRIWWCLVQFDCLVSLCYGRPQSINLDDCDVAPLSTEDLDGSMSPSAAGFVVQHARLCTILSDLARSHFSVRVRKHNNSRRDGLQAVDRALAEWMMSLPPALREQSWQSGTDSGPWPLMLHVTYNTALIQFHRPGSGDVSDASSAEYSADDQVCSDAASNIIRIFDLLHRRSQLRHCWFWAPSALFTALLQLSGQVKCANPIMALRAKGKYDSGLYSLRKLTRYWLFATSVMRLFQSNSIKPWQMESGGVNRPAPSQVTDVPSSEQESPELSVSPVSTAMTQMSTTVAVSPEQMRFQEMDWVQMFSEGDAAAHNMHLEQNRWQHSMSEWQSLYWSDPLAGIHLEDNTGVFHADWGVP